MIQSISASKFQIFRVDKNRLFKASIGANSNKIRDYFQLGSKLALLTKTPCSFDEKVL